MTQKTSLLDQAETITMLEEFLKFAKAGLVDVRMVKASVGNPVKNTTEVTFKMTEFLTLPALEIVMKSHVDEKDIVEAMKAKLSRSHR
jgi:hypothetical protein